MNDCIELSSVFPENNSSTLNFAKEGNLWACCTCAYSMPTSLVSAAIWAACGLCADMAHSTTHCNKALHIIVILKRSPIDAKCKCNKQNKATKLIQKKIPPFLQFQRPFFFGWSIISTRCCDPKMARYWANTFHSLHCIARCFQVMYLDQQCSWCSQSKKRYSHSQSKEKTLGTGQFSTNFLLFSTAFCTPIGSKYPELYSSYIF